MSDGSKGFSQRLEPGEEKPQDWVGLESERWDTSVVALVDISPAGGGIVFIDVRRVQVGYHALCQRHGLSMCHRSTYLHRVSNFGLCNVFMPR